MQSESTVVCKLLPPRIFWAGVLFPHFLHQYFLVIFFLFSQYPILFYLCGLYLFVFLYIKYFSHCPFYLPSQSTTIFLSNTLTSVSVQSLSRVWLFATAWTALCQASLSITNSQNLLKLMSIESVMPSNHLILCRLLLPPSIFSSIKVFGGQSIGVSALTSVLPKNIQHWFPLGWTGWISLQSQETLQEFFLTPQFKSINSSVLSFLYSPTLTSIHDYWKNHSLD